MKSLLFIGWTGFLGKSFFDYLNNAKLNKKKLSKIISKKKFLKYKINGVLVGDLFYDTFLRFKLKETIDINDQTFRIFLFEQLKIFYFWDNFFTKNKVKSLILSHTVYSMAIPLRIAVKKNIPTYVSTYSTTDFFDKKK